MTNVTKATRATITLGDIELDVFQLPDGSYRMSKAQTCETIQLDRKRLSQLLEKKSLKAIVGKDSTLSQLIVKAKVDVGRGNITAELIPLEMATLLWLEAGGELGKLLAYACITESLESRADEAFGRARAAEEKNQMLKARMRGKISRRSLTDSIHDYVELHPELSNNYKRFIYSNCSECLNVFVLGHRAKAVKEILGLPENSLIRNAVPAKALYNLEAVERLASIFIDEDDLEPLEAVKLAIQQTRVKQIDIQ